MNFDVGQVWKRGHGIWETGKKIVDVDRRRSVTFFQVEPLYGGNPSWLSEELFRIWVEESGSALEE